MPLHQLSMQEAPALVVEHLEPILKLLQPPSKIVLTRGLRRLTAFILSVSDHLFDAIMYLYESTHL
jgi:hypothetical protein